MTPLFSKLNLKDQREIAVLNAPEAFDAELAKLSGVTVLRSLEGAGVGFAIAFASQQSELDALSAALADGMEGDATLWVAYPKQSSKRYTCDFNRDTGWTVLGRHGFEPVRQVSIDEDWSALRFRRVEHIGKMTRRPSMTISEEGRRKARHSP